MDKIILRNLEVQGIIGVYAWERTTPQTIRITIVLDLELHAAGVSDNVAESIDYAELADQIRKHARSAARLTIEALAEDLCQLCLRQARLQQVTVRIEKPGALPGAEYAAVELTRSRG